MAILHRKSSLFYKTETGAKMGDTYMSIVHTCEHAKVNPFEYLTAIITHAQLVADNPSAWLPWNYIDALNAVADAQADRSPEVQAAA